MAGQSLSLLSQLPLASEAVVDGNGWPDLSLANHTVAGRSVSVRDERSLWGNARLRELPSTSTSHEHSELSVGHKEA